MMGSSFPKGYDTKHYPSSSEGTFLGGIGKKQTIIISQIIKMQTNKFGSNQLLILQ
jgi:hypothetical protein